MEVKINKTLLETNLFRGTIKRLEKNTDIDPVTFDADKKRFYEMKKLNQDKVIAGRSISEILKDLIKKLKIQGHLMMEKNCKNY